MKCTMPDCPGAVDKSVRISLRTSCATFATAHPCQKCGRVHWPDGEAVFNRPGQLVDWRGGAIVHVDPESEA